MTRVKKNLISAFQFPIFCRVLTFFFVEMKQKDENYIFTRAHKERARVRESKEKVEKNLRILEIVKRNIFSKTKHSRENKKCAHLKRKNKPF